MPVQGLSDGSEQLMLMHLEMAAMSPMCSNKIELLLLYTCVQLRKCFQRQWVNWIEFYVFYLDHRGANMEHNFK